MGLKLSPERVQARLKKVKIRLLRPYVDQRTRLKTECLVCGNVWSPMAGALLQKVGQGRGCPDCGRRRAGEKLSISLRLSQEEVKRRFQGLKIKLLGTYINQATKVKAKCLVCGAVWMADAQCWGCRKCAARKRGLRRRVGISEVKRRLKKISPTLRVLSKVYEGSDKPLRVKCLVCSTKWGIVWNALRAGHGCPQCNRYKVRTLATIRADVRRKNSNIEVRGCYQNLNSVLSLSCKKCGGKWEASWKKLRYSLGRCPGCTPHLFGVSEEQVRREMEKLTGWKFPKAKPSEVPWLHGLHLDGYNKKHGVAFEHQGPHHYRPTHWTKFDDQAFLKQKRNDMRKVKQCQRHGVRLICIPYWVENIRDYLSSRLKK
jgi:Zn finger protein HypA/HybF involved in hydrogenase expression